MTSSGTGWAPCQTAESAAWLDTAGYPYPVDRTGKGWLNDRFRNLIRILHPAYIGEEEEPVPWRRIAEHNSVEIAGPVTFGEIAGNPSPNFVLREVYDTTPEMGSLPAELTPAVYRLLKDAQYGLIWDGFADPGLERYLEPAARFRMKGERIVYKSLVRDDSTRFTLDRTPSFWWPQSRNWCAATGLDSVETLVASSDIEILDKIAKHPALEVQFLR